MELKIHNITIDQQAITPTLTIGVMLEFGSSLEAPLSISGRLSVDGKVVSLLSEYQFGSNDTYFGLRPLTKAERDKIWREKSNSSYYSLLTASLSENAIEHIELSREKDHEKSVRFNMDFIVKYLDMPATPDEQTYEFLKVHIKRCSINTDIKQSEWVKNYSPQLGIGNFLLLELEIPDQHSVSKEWVALYDRLSLRLTEINSAIRSGDWQKAMNSGRQFYENLKIGDSKAGHKKFEDELRKLFVKDQHSLEGIQNFLDGIWKFFEYNSKFVHDKDKAGNLNPIPLATKEDAYFIYALGVGLLNVIGKKISKQ